MRALVGVLVVSFLVAGCGDAAPSTAASRLPSDAIAVVASADVAVGEGRILVAVAGPDGVRLGSPADSVAIEVAPADQPELRQRVDGVFTWIIEGAFGLYRAEFDFDRPGIWNVVVVPVGGPPLGTAFVEVRGDSIAPGVGDAAPQIPTPTVANTSLEDLTTDPVPDQRFYELSLDEAATSGARTVAVFSTPGFCRTATCGPLLDQVKELAPSYPATNFVHVEIYAGFNESDFVPDGTHLAPAVSAGAWNLPSEPWVFVIDGSGIITHRFEGVMDPAELIGALG